jgi:hypothetical protein
VLTRMLDGVEPGLVGEIRHAAEHVPGIEQVVDAKARWVGHKLHADVTIAVNDNLTVTAANEISASLQRELFGHLPALEAANVRFAMSGGGAALPSHQPSHGHHHAPEPIPVRTQEADGLLEIVDTPGGERMRLTLSRTTPDLEATVVIRRPGNVDEILDLAPVTGDRGVLQSSVAPAEPHEFDAELRLSTSGTVQAVPFRMVEPPDHHH